MKQAALMNDICIHENSIAHLKFTAQWSDVAGRAMHYDFFKSLNDVTNLDNAPMLLKVKVRERSKYILNRKKRKMNTSI